MPYRLMLVHGEACYYLTATAAVKAACKRARVAFDGDWIKQQATLLKGGIPVYVGRATVEKVS
jgi:hypothetical protein